MRTATALTLAGCAALAFVAGFVSWSHVHEGRETSSPPPSDRPLPPAQFVLPVTTVTWQPTSAGDFEVHSRGHYDFWFENRDSVPVEIAIAARSCACSNLGLLVLPPAEARAVRSSLLSGAAAQFCAARNGALALLCERSFPQPFLFCGLGVDQTHVHAPWDAADLPVTVPPGFAGIMRLSWTNRLGHPSQWRVAAEISAKAASVRDEVRHRLELPIRLVPVFWADVDEVDVGTLSKEELRTAEFLCWSSTRLALPLRVEEKSHDPFFASSYSPLTEEERSRLAASTSWRILAAHKVRITIRGGGAPGTFAREIFVTIPGDPGGDQLLVTVTGTFR